MFDQCRRPDAGQVASAPETRRCEKPLVPVPEARHWSSCFSAGNQTLWKTLSTSAGSQTLAKLLQRRKPDAVRNPKYKCRRPDTGQVASAPETRRCEKCRKPDTGQVASAPETRRCEKPFVPVPEARHWSSCFSAGNQTLWKTLSTSAGSQTLAKLLQRRKPDAVRNPKYKCRRPDTCAPCPNAGIQTKGRHSLSTKRGTKIVIYCCGDFQYHSHFSVTYHFAVAPGLFAEPNETNYVTPFLFPFWLSDASSVDSEHMHGNMSILHFMQTMDQYFISCKPWTR